MRATFLGMLLVLGETGVGKEIISEAIHAKSPRAAWSYEAPQPKMKPVDHWIGFWEDVAIQ